MCVRSIGREDTLVKEMATHSSILAWRRPWTEEPGGLQSIRWQRAGHDWSNFARTHGIVYMTMTIWNFLDSWFVRTYIVSFKIFSVFVVAVVQLLNCVWLFTTNPMDCSMPGFSVLHYLPEFAPIHVQNFNVYAELCIFSFITGSRISLIFCLCDKILTYEERFSVSTSQVLYKTVLTMGFPRSSVVKNPLANTLDVSSIPGLVRSPGEGNGKPLQYSCLSMNRGGWWATVHGAAKEPDMT